MGNTISEKYLGMVIDHQGSNKHNITARVARGMSAINEICSIMEENWFGPYFFEVLTTLRNALLINSILSNASVWYNVKQKEIEQLEKCDSILMARGPVQLSCI